MRYGNGMDDLTTMNDNSKAAITTAENGDIYVIAAHPAWRESRVNRPMMEAARSVQRNNIRDLYSNYPDYAIDVAREQAALERARLVVLLHPIQWYSMPPLQKLWLDEVLTHGWAYGVETSALRGKDLWLVASTGGPADSYHPQGYNRYFFDAFLPPYEQTATLCGMRFLPPLILHGSHACSLEEVTGHVETFRERLQSYPDWPEMDDIEQCPTCVVPQQDRPQHEADTVSAQVSTGSIR